MLRIVRKLLGELIILGDRIFSPRSVKRTAKEQELIDSKTRSLILYEFRGCPFCIKVKRFMKRHSLDIEIRDVKKCDRWLQELAAEGGKVKVPCLRIDKDDSTQWLYESNDIITYLNTRVLAQVESLTEMTEASLRR